ncbi:MAG: hypothetical protein R3F33_02090 [Planctomycetota bacterium]
MESPSEQEPQPPRSLKDRVIRAGWIVAIRWGALLTGIAVIGLLLSLVCAKTWGPWGWFRIALLGGLLWHLDLRKWNYYYFRPDKRRK